MSVILNADMRAVIRSAHLCFAATVTPDCQPNVSPKGTIRVWDDTYLFFLDIASPRTRANLLANTFMELNVVEQLSRRGYRFFGRAEIHQRGETYDTAVAMVLAEEDATYDVAAVVLLEVERAAALVSPGYWRVADENAMRSCWRERRSALDREFESHLETYGGFQIKS